MQYMLRLYMVKSNRLPSCRIGRSEWGGRVTSLVDSIECIVYRASKREDTYLFVARCDELKRVPQSLMQMLGRLDFVMNLTLRPERPLAQSDPLVVMHQLVTDGYYLQLPPQGPGRDDTIN